TGTVPEMGTVLETGSVASTGELTVGTGTGSPMSASANAAARTRPTPSAVKMRTRRLPADTQDSRCQLDLRHAPTEPHGCLFEWTRAGARGQVTGHLTCRSEVR